MDCPSCGAVAAAGARYCWSCGQILRAPTEERRIVTVLFADLVGFTAMSERLDPEQVKRLVDHAFERLVRDVTAFGGRVDKIVGDAIVALFGAPVAHEDDAERAVRAALRMQQTLAEQRGEGGPDGAPSAASGIRMRIGVNTGEVLVGALRAGGDYTAMGDVVNTASRLQTLAQPGEVLVGDSTHSATHTAISYESRGAVVVRGREQPLEVWSAVEAVRPPGYRQRRPTSPLFGRDREIGILSNAVDVSVTHGRGQMVLILGEAGVGKSRLADELADVAGAPGALVQLTGRCVPYGEANPWWPVAEALRSGCGVHRDDPLDVARSRTTEVVASTLTDVPDELPDESYDATPPDAMASVVDGLLHLMGYEGPLRGLDGTRARAEATQALLTFLEAALRRRPVMVRLADLHWADQAVLDLVDDLCTRLARFPFVFVATARGSLQERWTPRIGRFNSLVLNLDPLERDAAALLLDTLTGPDLDPSTREALLDRSGGNPFYLEELATLFGSDGLAISGGLAVSSDGAWVEVPDTLHGLVAARIDALSAEEQQVLQDAAVWGSSGRLDVVNQMASAMRDVRDVSQAVSSLAQKDVLVFDGHEWAFRSHLVREVTYARLTMHERLVRHLGIAEFLERKVEGASVDDGTVDTIAHHFVLAARLGRDLGVHTRAELSERAVRWSLDAARRAMSDAAWPLAVRLFTEALELLDPAPTEARFSALIGRSQALAESWDEVGARHDASDALVVAEEMADASMRARALLAMATAAARAGERSRAEDELVEAIAAFDEIGDLGGRAEGLRQMGMAALLRGETAAAERPITGALEAFRAVGDERGVAWSLQNLAWISLSEGRLAEADEFVIASEGVFRDLSDSGGLAWAQGLLAFVRLQQGDLRSASGIADRILRECERRGDRFGEGMMLTVRAHVQLWQGQTSSAVASARRAVAAFRTSPDLSGTIGMEQAQTVAGRAAIMAGELAEGRRLLSDAIHTGRGKDGIAGFAVGVATVTGVQIGMPDRLLDQPTELWMGAGGPGRTGEHAAVYALGLAQVGRVEEAARWALDALSDEPDHGYVAACASLALAAAGLPDEAVAAAGRVAGSPNVTYLDRIWADVAMAMVDEDGDAALDRAEAALGDGEDAVAVALVDLARRVVRARSEGRLHQVSAGLFGELDMSDTRWVELLVRAAGGVATPVGAVGGGAVGGGAVGGGAVGGGAVDDGAARRPAVGPGTTQAPSAGEGA